MKKVLFAVATMMLLVACNGKQNANGADNDSVAANDVASANAENVTYFDAIDKYMVEEIGKNYSDGKYRVPMHNVVAVDESDAKDIKVWADFWLFNYDLVGDTLKCMSGGSYPGLMHIEQNDKGFEVKAFDRVEDGSNFLPSAKKIFGDKFEAFQKINGDENKREQLRAEVLAEFVKKEGIAATLYQDYGWPAKKIATAE